MGSRLNYGSDAWGGSWGAVSAWGGSWGWSWGPLHEVEEHPEYYGGGRRRGLLDDERLHREHWDYIDGLREIRDLRERTPDEARAPDPVVPVAKIEEPARAMRGNVAEPARPVTVASILEDPAALSMLAVLIAEADD